MHDWRVFPLIPVLYGRPAKSETAKLSIQSLVYAFEAKTFVSFHDQTILSAMQFAACTDVQSSNIVLTCVP